MIDTPGALYDELHRRFGIGTYDESTATKPWWKERNVEVSKIKAMMRKRKVPIEDLVLAMEFATEHQRAVTQAWQLFEHISDAKRWRRQAQADAATDVRTRLTEAAAEAMEQGNTTWAARLYNASEDAGVDVLRQWSDERSKS